jgi:hypothetical protein
LALAEDRVLTALPLPLAIEVFLLALAALPSPAAPQNLFNLTDSPSTYA